MFRFKIYFIALLSLLGWKNLLPMESDKQMTKQISGYHSSIRYSHSLLSYVSPRSFAFIFQDLPLDLQRIIIPLMFIEACKTQVSFRDLVKRVIELSSVNHFFLEELRKVPIKSFNCSFAHYINEGLLNEGLFQPYYPILTKKLMIDGMTQIITKVLQIEKLTEVEKVFSGMLDKTDKIFEEKVLECVPHEEKLKLSPGLLKLRRYDLRIDKGDCALEITVLTPPFSKPYVAPIASAIGTQETLDNDEITSDLVQRSKLFKRMDQKLRDFKDMLFVNGLDVKALIQEANSKKLQQVIDTLIKSDEYLFQAKLATMLCYALFFNKEDVALFLLKHINNGELLLNPLIIALSQEHMHIAHHMIACHLQSERLQKRLPFAFEQLLPLSSFRALVSVYHQLDENSKNLLEIRALKIAKFLLQEIHDESEKNRLYNLIKETCDSEIAKKFIFQQSAYSLLIKGYIEKFYKEGAEK